MEKMYIEIQEIKKDVKTNTDKIDNVDKRIDNVEKRIENVEKITLHIEQDHGKKLEALFDGYKQNSEKLDRIEKEVSKHEEVILRRIK